jgi:hypothetical protein
LRNHKRVTLAEEHCRAHLIAGGQVVGRTHVLGRDHCQLWLPDGAQMAGRRKTLGSICNSLLFLNCPKS